jgi:hypothetical protein
VAREDLVILTTAIASLLLAATPSESNLNDLFRRALYMNDPWFFWGEIPEDQRREILGKIIRGLDKNPVWSDRMATFLMTMMIEPTGFVEGGHNQWKVWISEIPLAQRVLLLRWFADWSDTPIDLENPGHVRTLVLFRRNLTVDNGNIRGAMELQQGELSPEAQEEVTKATYTFLAKDLRKLREFNYMREDMAIRSLPVPPPKIVWPHTTPNQNIPNAFYYFPALAIDIHLAGKGRIDTRSLVFDAMKSIDTSYELGDVHGHYIVLSAWTVP